MLRVKHTVLVVPRLLSEPIGSGGFSLPCTCTTTKELRDWPCRRGDKAVVIRKLSPIPGDNKTGTEDRTRIVGDFGPLVESTKEASVGGTAARYPYLARCALTIVSRTARPAHG
jgi:hypothetical protein